MCVYTRHEPARLAVFEFMLLQNCELVGSGTIKWEQVEFLQCFDTVTLLSGKVVHSLDSILQLSLKVFFCNRWWKKPKFTQKMDVCDVSAASSFYWCAYVLPTIAIESGR